MYDKEKKRGRKVTGKYLGRITEADGLLAPRTKKPEKRDESYTEEAYRGK